jgi:hypothetical protein
MDEEFRSRENEEENGRSGGNAGIKKAQVMRGEGKCYLVEYIVIEIPPYFRDPLITQYTKPLLSLSDMLVINSISKSENEGNETQPDFT